MVKETVSYRLVRHMLQKYTSKEVSHKGVLYVQDLLDNILKNLSRDSLKELERINSIRQQAKLYEIKRMPLSIFKNLSDKNIKWEWGN